MASDVKRAISAATEPAPANLRFSVALAAWVAVMALGYAFMVQGSHADTDKVVY